MQEILSTILSRLDSLLGWWMALPVLLAAALGLLLVMLLLRGGLLGAGLDNGMLHDGLRRSQRCAQALILLVIALGCLVTGLLGGFGAPYGGWGAHLLSGLLPIVFHAAGVLLWLVVALWLVRCAGVVAFGPLDRNGANES